MRDREVRLMSVVAAAMWVTGAIVVLAGIEMEIYGLPGAGLLAALGAAVLNVRGFVEHHHDQMRQMFECGRDYERSLVDTRVRSLR
jgi:hypothetical protein